MPSVSRETVIEAVKEYGLAWTTQDVKRIGRLFTKGTLCVMMFVENVRSAKISDA